MTAETTVRYARELACYEKHRAGLERKHRGKIALMHGDELVGVFKTWDSAAAVVVRRFGQPPEQCYWQEIGEPIRLRPMWGVDPDEPPPPPQPPFEVYFAQELATYERHRAERERHHLGQFVLVHGDELLGFFKTATEALVEGSRRYGDEKFMLKEIGDPIYDFPNCVPA